MLERTKNWGLTVALVSLTGAAACASEPIVQDFDGWKITIRPGVSSIPGPIPSPPQPALAATPQSLVQLVSLRQQPTPVTPPATAEKAAPAPADDDLPVIIPGESDWAVDTRPAVSPPEGAVDPRYLSQMYYEIYKSIPFIRAEYDANPSYLHDTAVEFLFGKMRPTVIHRGTVNVNQNCAGGCGYDVPWAYGGRGYGWGGYMYPPLQLVVPGTGLRIHRLN